MTTSQNPTPQLRFRGFDEPWKRRKFGELYEKSNKKNDLTYGREKIISVANMYYKQDSLIADDNYLLTYNVFELGDIAFEGNRSKDFSHGRFVENTIGDGIVSHVFDVFKPIMPEYDLWFWKYLINSENIMGGALLRSTKASTMMTNLVAADFLQESTLVPTCQEQHKIGRLFQKLDHLITLEKKKHEKLKNVKKALLIKMFPQNGSTSPDIRFSGFTEPWEKRKFEDIATRVSATSSAVSLPRIEYEDIVPDLGVLNKDIKTKKSDKLGVVFNPGDVLYGKLRPYLRNWFLPTFSGLAIGDFWVLRPQNVDSGFLFRLIQGQQFSDAANQSVGTKMPRADWGLVSEISLYVPTSIKEQHKIGQLFQKLDRLITLEQQTCDKLQNIKKALLEKMFLEG